MRDASPQGTYKVQALDRAFAVLDLLGESETPLGLAQVASSLQLHKSTAHRFLMVLERHHMVERTSSGKFRLGLRLRFRLMRGFAPGCAAATERRRQP